MQAKESEATPSPTVRCPTRIASYTIIIYAEELNQTHTGSLMVGSVSVEGTRLVLPRRKITQGSEAGKFVAGPLVEE